MHRISNIETAVLGLVCEKPRYGYELEKIIEEREMRNWTEIGFSSIYYVLKRLEKYGYIKSKFEGVPGKPARKVYSITNKGNKVMLETVKDFLSTTVKPHIPFELGMAYMKFLPPQDVLACLNSYLKSLDDRLNHLQDKLSFTQQSKAPFHVIALFTRPIALVKAERIWVKVFIRDYQEYNKNLRGK